MQPADPEPKCSVRLKLRFYINIFVLDIVPGVCEQIFRRKVTERLNKQGTNFADGRDKRASNTGAEKRSQAARATLGHATTLFESYFVNKCKNK